MKWYDYMKRNKEINYNFLKEKKNCRLKVGIINVGGEILIYKHTTCQNMYTYVRVVRQCDFAMCGAGWEEGFIFNRARELKRSTVRLFDGTAEVATCIYKQKA